MSDLPPPFAQISRPVNLRASPDASAPIVSRLAAGTDVEVLGQVGEWLQVRDGKTEGYVNRKRVDLGESASAKETEGAEVSDRDAEPLLSRGARGKAVLRLQELLTGNGYPVAKDEVFGPQTEDALRRFQQTSGMAVDGIAGPSTWSALTTVSGDGAEALTTATHTISDQPVRDLAGDRLGFRPSVNALVGFLRARETRPPLAIAICAAWGQGKTSFMRMIEDRLCANTAEAVRFARVWFNPWMYDDAEQVWAALLAAIAGRIRASLGWRRRLGFELQRFGRNLRNRFDLGLLLKLLVIVGAGLVFIWLLYDPALQALSQELMLDVVGEKGRSALESSWVAGWLPVLAAAFVAYQVHLQVVKKFNQGLLAHLRETSFRDKIGTLAEFEDEMAILNQSMPTNLKVVVFVDDLDRCKPAILSELIEALQLLEVSRKCIYVLGMDLRVVARTVRKEYAKLNPEVGAAAVLDRNELAGLQHGPGYRFLEKIIQARVSVPGYDEDRMRAFAASLGAAAASDEPDHSVADRGGTASNDGVADQSPASSPDANGASVPRDSPEMLAAIETYGGRHFRNPRRLKRWLNGFRLHAYLSRGLEDPPGVDRLARFLVLSEKWPRLVEWLYRHPKALDDWLREPVELPKLIDRPGTDELIPLLDRALALPEVGALLHGKQPGQAINGDWLVRMCDWYGFQYYP